MILNRRIRTLLYDDQRFTEFEIDLLHTPALQRLYDLHQLGYADRVFVDASHSRLHHVIGVIEQADKIMSAIVTNLRKYPKQEFRFGHRTSERITGRRLAALTRSRRPAVRLMALLHDLTHSPYGHTLEDEIKLVQEKHDEPARQADAFYRLVLQYFGWIERNERKFDWGVKSSNRPDKSKFAEQLDWYLDAPDIHSPPDGSNFRKFCVNRWRNLLTEKPDPGIALRRLSPPALQAGIKDLRFAIACLLHLSAAHEEPNNVREIHLPASNYPVLCSLDELLEASGPPLSDSEKFNPNRDAYLLDVIGNTICADLLDYAQRDSTQSGLKLAYDSTRIMANMTVVSTTVVQNDIETKEGLKPFPFNNDSLRSAVSIFSHKLRLDVPGELLNLLQVRFYVYERVLYHSTKCIAGAMLGAAMQNIGWRTLPRHWRYVGDSVFVREAHEAARYIRDILHSLPSQDQPFGQEQIDEFNSRLEALPDTGLAEAIRHWVSNRSTIAYDDLIGRLKALTELSRNRAAALGMHKEMIGMKEKLAPQIPASQWGQIRTRLLEIAKQNNSSGDNIVEVILPTVGRISDEVNAGIRLLQRLAARRFHKVVFRLLPNASDANGGPTGLSPEQIAKKFLHPVTRRLSEWAIAGAAGIPRGSVVIHCPPAEGPKKIANILMTDGKSSEKPKLRELSKLDPDLFKHHEIAVKTQEDTYQSTWRLSVSLAPPYDAEWMRINPIIGRVLHSALGGAAQLINDVHMERELQGQVDSVHATYVRDLAASARHITDEQDLSELANGVVDLLAELKIDVDSDPDEILSTLRGRLTAARPATKLWKNQNAARDRLSAAFGPLFKTDERSISLYRGMVKLTTEQQEWLDNRLQTIAVPKNVQDNRATDADRDQIFDTIEELIAQAAGI